jgi:hypothetical protein
MIKPIDFENLSISKKISIYDFHQLILSFTLLGIGFSRQWWTSSYTCTFTFLSEASLWLYLALEMQKSELPEALILVQK